MSNKTTKQKPETLILVDAHDNQVGLGRKIDVHLGDGQRHRAFTAILINDKKQILMVQRSLKKPLWPTFWDGSFSSHPNVGEILEQACERRAKQELGIKAKNFKKLIKYNYHKKWSEVFSEWECNHILQAKFNGDIIPNLEEVMDYKWLSWKEI